jgi:hypothetical protein
MRAPETNQDDAALALRALGWTLGEPDRARRLLDTTGLDPAELRARAGESAVLAAALGFLEAYEPDLIACAAALNVSPAAIVTARRGLESE